MSSRRTGIAAAVLLAVSISACSAPHQDAAMAANPQVSQYGIVAQKSRHPFGETIALLKADIVAKKLVFFDAR